MDRVRGLAGGRSMGLQRRFAFRVLLEGRTFTWGMSI